MPVRVALVWCRFILTGGCWLARQGTGRAASQVSDAPFTCGCAGCPRCDECDECNECDGHCGNVYCVRKGEHRMWLVAGPSFPLHTCPRNWGHAKSVAWHSPREHDIDIHPPLVVVIVHCLPRARRCVRLSGARDATLHIWCRASSRFKHCLSSVPSSGREA